LGPLSRIRRLAVPLKPGPTAGPSPLRRLGAAESEEPSSLGGERLSYGRRLDKTPKLRLVARAWRFSDQRRPHRKEGQQACPIRPQIDRFPMGTQAGFTILRAWSP